MSGAPLREPPLLEAALLEPPLLEADGLAKHFPLEAGTVRAVDDVSFAIARGEVLGLVGESGSGKTTVGRLLVRLLRPTVGRVIFDGTELTHLSDGEFRPFRRRIQFVFQDPFASLDPRMRVGDIVGEGLVIHGLGARAERRDRVAALLEMVGLSPGHARRYPHEFSGGQRQRIGVARALAVGPELLIADEPVSALDVSVKAQVINLLSELQARLSLALLFIAHDLAAVQSICDRVAVMYLGRLMEIGPVEEVYGAPRHPYTAALLSAVPRLDPDDERSRIVLQGEIPSPADPPSGCVFRTRCPYAIAACAAAVPPLREVAPQRRTACIRDDILQ